MIITRTLGASLVALGLMAAPAMAQMANMTMAPSAPAAAQASYSAASKTGLYTVALAPNRPVALNVIDSWTMAVTNAQGAPVEGATITVDGGMPAHGHGLPTAPQVTQALGNGQYLLEGVRFNMSGAWVLNVTVAAPAGTDVATVEIAL
jgi:hypothetical protein